MFSIANYTTFRRDYFQNHFNAFKQQLINEIRMQVLIYSDHFETAIKRV